MLLLPLEPTLGKKYPEPPQKRKAPKSCWAHDKGGIGILTYYRYRYFFFSCSHKACLSYLIMHFLVLEHFFYYRYSFSCYLKSCICFSGIVKPQEKRSGAREQILLEGQLQKVTEFISYLENWSNFELFYTCLVCSAAVISYSSTPRVPFRY